MLILTRKATEQIVVGENIVITLVSIDRGHVRIGIEAPRDIPIWRRELLDENNKPIEARA